MLGPQAIQRIFYPGPLPSSYQGSDCSLLPAKVTCIISYKTPTLNVASYVRTTPSSRDVIFIFHHEPENDWFAGRGSNGQNFVTEFETQSVLIRRAADGAPNIKIAMAAEAFEYQPGTRWHQGVDCGYIPPASYVSYYLADIYESDPDGRALPYSPVAVQWDTWLRCVTEAMKADPSAQVWLGVAEYGLGTLTGDKARARTIAADAVYLPRQVPRFALWEYWWEDNSINWGCTVENCDWQFTDPATIREWRSLESR
jgi:hypothetical protein